MLTRKQQIALDIAEEQVAYKKMSHEKLLEAQSGKIQFVPTPDGISAEQAHQVAMVAAHAVTINIDKFDDIKDIGSRIAQSYLQAYEAVEGWTKPQTMEEFNARHGTSYVADRAHMEELQRKAKSSQGADYFTNQAASLQPKDA